MIAGAQVREWRVRVLRSLVAVRGRSTAAGMIARGRARSRTLFAACVLHNTRPCAVRLRFREPAAQHVVCRAGGAMARRQRRGARAAAGARRGHGLSGLAHIGGGTVGGARCAAGRRALAARTPLWTLRVGEDFLHQRFLLRRELEGDAGERATSIYVCWQRLCITCASCLLRRRVAVAA